LGGVGVREAAQTHQQADGERRERHPGSQHVGHLRRRRGELFSLSQNIHLKNQKIYIFCSILKKEEEFI